MESESDMGQKHKKTAKNVVHGLDAVDFARMSSMLKNQLNAKKRMFLGHRGVVNQSKAFPDHKAQLRAAIELCKIYGLFPQRGEREARDLFNRCERPIINLVILDPDSG